MYRTLLDGVRYIAFSMRTISLLKPYKQGAVLSSHTFFSGRFYKLACDGFLPIVPEVFLHKGA